LDASAAYVVSTSRCALVTRNTSPLAFPAAMTENVDVAATAVTSFENVAGRTSGRRSRGRGISFSVVTGGG
jgi:hypothetical protein